MEGNFRRSAVLGSRGTDGENKTSKVSIHQLMNKIFIDTSTTDTKKEYINKKSEEFDEKIKKEGYRNSSLDLRSFEKFYNESNAKTEFSINKIYEFFLNYMNNNLEEQNNEIFSKKISLFQKMLYIFFETNEEKIKIARLIKSFSDDEKRKIELLYKEKNIEDIEIEKNIVVNENNLENKDTVVLIKAQIEWIKEIERKEKEIKDILENIEYYQDIDDLEAENKEKLRKENLEKEKEEISKKINEYQNLIEQNFAQKEAICKLLNIFLLGIDNAIEEEENEKKIDIGINENSYKNLLHIFKLILENSNFNVKNMETEEFLSFLVRNKVKLIDIFTIILTETLKNSKKEVVEKEKLGNLFEFYDISESEKKDIKKDDNLFKGEIVKVINYENARKKIINYVKRKQKEMIIVFENHFKEILEVYTEIENEIMKEVLFFDGNPKTALSILKEYFNIEDENLELFKKNIEDFYNFKKKKFFSNNKNEMLGFEKLKIGKIYDFFDKIKFYENEAEKKFYFKRELEFSLNKTLEKDFFQNIKLKIENLEIKLRDDIKSILSNMIFNVLNYGKLLQKDSFYYPEEKRKEIYKDFEKEFQNFIELNNQIFDYSLKGIKENSRFEVIFNYDFEKKEIKYSIFKNMANLFADKIEYLADLKAKIVLEVLELENTEKIESETTNKIFFKINSTRISKDMIKKYYDYIKEKKKISENVIKNTKKMFELSFQENLKSFSSENDIRKEKMLKTKNEKIKIIVSMLENPLIESFKTIQGISDFYFKTTDEGIEKIYNANETIMFYNKKFATFILKYMFSLNAGKNNYSSQEFNYEDKITQEELKKILKVL